MQYTPEREPSIVAVERGNEKNLLMFKLTNRNNDSFLQISYHYKLRCHEFNGSNILKKCNNPVNEEITLR